MPGTTLALTVAALGIIGVPPVVGFVSKWFLGLGAVEAGMAIWVLPVLVVGSLRNAAYFLPILYRAWFYGPPKDWPADHVPAHRDRRCTALVAGNHRDSVPRRRSVCCCALQPAGVGRINRETRVRPVNGLFLIALVLLAATFGLRYAGLQSHTRRVRNQFFRRTFGGIELR